MGDFSRTKGSTKEDSKRAPSPQTAALMNLIMRALGGQLVNPPETAISTPQQQAISNAQGGFGALANRLGVGATQSLQPGPNQVGLESRAQLGLPPRSSYNTFIPTAEQFAALGGVPPISQAADRPRTKLGRLGDREAKATAAGNEKRAGRIGAKIQKIKTRHPEIS